MGKSVKFIDRKVEQDMFDDLISLKENPRILTIKDEGGMGKSSLLKRLRYKCRYILPFQPVCLINLDDAGLIKDSLTLIEQIKIQLAPSDGSTGIIFKNFDKINHARKIKDRNALSEEDTEEDTVGAVSADHAQISGDAVVAGEIDSVVHVHLEGAEDVKIDLSNIGQSEVEGERAWDSSDEEDARKLSIEAFFDDLVRICEESEQPIVILFDAWERCNDAIMDWLLIAFLYPYCFDLNKRPENLLFVLAGRRVPDFEEMLGDKYQDLVKSIKELSEWEEKHINEFLIAHGYEQLTKNKLFTRLMFDGIKKDWSLRRALDFARVYHGHYIDVVTE